MIETISEARASIKKLQEFFEGLCENYPSQSDELQSCLTALDLADSWLVQIEEEGDRHD